MPTVVDPAQGMIQGQMLILRRGVCDQCLGKGNGVLLVEVSQCHRFADAHGGFGAGFAPEQHIDHGHPIFALTKKNKEKKIRDVT